MARPASRSRRQALPYRAEDLQADRVGQDHGVVPPAVGGGSAQSGDVSAPDREPEQRPAADPRAEPAASVRAGPRGPEHPVRSVNAGAAALGRGARMDARAPARLDAGERAAAADEKGKKLIAAWNL